MYERLKFEVHVERATPACSEYCENLSIMDDHDVMWTGNGTKMVVSKYTCANASYCSNLWRHMKDSMEDKNADREQ